MPSSCKLFGFGLEIAQADGLHLGSLIPVFVESVLISE